MIDLKIKLPDNFLDEEIRCDYLVSHEMKEVWAVELDLLAELLRVCKKHNITIFASGGTMLGAVRHKGFIPWDDDIDMVMFRDDYNKLCEVATEEFKYPYFFQTEYTDNGSLRGHIQLRNSLTAGILSGELQYKFKFNQGIFLDIFPLDSVIEDKNLFTKQEKRAHFYKKMAIRCSLLSTRFYKDERIFKYLIKKFIRFFSKTFFRKMEIYFYRKFEKECQKYNCIETEKICCLGFSFDFKANIRSRQDFNGVEEVPFEFISIPIPKNYKSVLHEMYGDYMKFVKGTSAHGGIIFDTSKSFVEYIK